MLFLNHIKNTCIFLILIFCLFSCYDKPKELPKQISIKMDTTLTDSLFVNNEEENKIIETGKPHTLR